jgi:hypothetical protein
MGDFSYINIKKKKRKGEINKMKLINNKMKGVFILSLLTVFFYINALNVFAGFKDDGTTIENENKGNVLETSDFYDEDNKGYILTEYYINDKASKTEAKKVVLKNYKYVRVLDENGKEIGLWLYDWTNTTFDEDILKETQKIGKTITAFHDPSGVSKYEITDIGYKFSSLFMWPISSSGDTYVKGTSAIKEAVKKHNISNFTEISKEKNFSLVYLLGLNTYPYGNSYVSSGYTYPIKAITDNSTKLKTMETIENIVGRPNTYSRNYSKYFLSNGVGNNYNGNINDVTQTFFEHINYFKYYSKSEAIKFSANMKTQSGFKYMFLTKDGNSLYPRIVWNADANSLGYGREVSNYTRSAGILTDGSFEKVSFRDAWNETTRSIDENWANGCGLSSDMGIVNQLVANDIGGNLSSKYYKNYEDVNEKAISTFWAFSRLYSTFYQKVSTRVANDPTWKEINEDIDIKVPTTPLAFNLLIKSDFETAYRFSQQMSIEMCKMFMISGYSCKETSSVLYVRTSGNGYRSFDSVKLSYSVDDYAATISRGDISIVNLPNSQSVMNNLTIVDLRKALSITDADYNSFISVLDALRGTNKDYSNIGLTAMLTKLENEKITFFTTPSGKRAATLLLAGFKGSDVGIYLTNPELEKGQIVFNANTKTLENLDSETVYVLATTLQYVTSHTRSTIPNIISGDYDISTYEGIYLEDNQTLSKADIKKKEKLQKLISKMAFPLFTEQINMYANNPRVQMMMIVSGTDKYATRETSVWTSAKKYLNQINTTLYESKINSEEAKKSLAKNYYYELFDFTKKPLVETNEIRFNTKAGERLKGITYISETAGRYFELVDADFTTSNIGAEGKLIAKTIGIKDVLIDYDPATALGSLVKRNSSFSLSATSTYGYWNLKNVYQTGEYDLANDLTYFATFQIPKYATKMVSGTIYARNIDGKLDNNPITTYTQTGKEKILQPSKLSTETKGVKFISKIVTDSSGVYEDFSKIDKIDKLAKVAYFLQENTLKLASIKQVNVKVTSFNKIYLDESGTLIIEVQSQEERTAFGKAVYEYLRDSLNKADNKSSLRLTPININLSLYQSYKTLGVNGITAILLNLYIQDSNKFNDISYISTGVNVAPEEILISNSLNKESTGTRNSIDWDSSTANYDIKSSLTVNTDKSLGSNILDNTNTIKADEAQKIRSKNTTLSTPTESTKIYGDVFIGRIPEAKKGGLYVGDYKVILFEQFNKTGFTPSSNTTINTRISYIYSSLKNGTTVSKYFDEMNTHYYSGILYNLALGKESLTNMKVIPIEYKEVSNPEDIKDKNNKLQMTGWKEVKDADKLAFTPGMVVKYRWEYNLPYGTQSTTIKYINAQAGRLYKSSFSTLASLTSLELDFVLVPALNENGKVKNEKSLTADTNYKNNYTKLFTNLTDGGNLLFVNVEVKAGSKSIYLKKYTYEEALKLNTLKAIVDAGDIPKDANGNFKEDLKVSVSVQYKNLTDNTKSSKNTALPLQVTNYFYSTPKTGTVNSPITGPYKDGTVIKYNENFTESTFLVIPTTKGVKPTDFIEIKCPLTDPRDSADNSIQDDFENIRIYVQTAPEEEKDNAITDIILYRSDKTVLGENNEGTNNNLLGQSIIKDETTKSIFVRTKVKRLIGNMTEDKYNLFLTLSYIADGQKINKSYTLNNNNSTLSKAGDIIYFDSEIISAAKTISNITIKADYRNNTAIDYDYKDNNMSNNTRTESFEAGYDIKVSLNDLPSYTINLTKGQDPNTTPINPKVSPSITTNVNSTLNNGMYLGEQISADVSMYLLNVSNNKKYYPDSVNGLSNYNKSSGTGKLAITGSASNTLSMNFKDLPLIAGECKVYISVKPDKYQLLETIPWDADPIKTNNISIKSFNVNTNTPPIIVTEPCLDANKTPSSIYWNTKFTWSNRVNSRPVQTDQWYSYTDQNGSTHRYFVCCSCNSQSGRNDGQSNWGPNGDRYNSYGVGQGPYYEKVTAIPYIWTSSNGWEISNDKEVYTGESIRVRLKVVHESNRDILPNALYYDEMGRNTPYSMNGIGHAWGCDYLSRYPGVSSIEGPKEMWYQISGTRGFDKTIIESYDSIEVNGLVDRTLWWDILPQVSIPVTNKKQEIYISYALVPYWGYNFSTDPLHTAKQLCTKGNIKITISPSTTIPGDDEYEGGINTGVE